ncbi:ComEC family competence protein [Patescibacteria group bacterium]|nr:ComEC family competence protein [Patescibacteria group bacterium]MBU3923086.1 ComEC family competence protein [Patescibacteria group bacterium]
MSLSNALVIVCLVFIVIIFFISPKFMSSLSEDKELIFIGKVIKEPDIRDTNTKLTVQTDSFRVLITVAKFPEYKYGDVLEIDGELKVAPVFEDFNYKEYLAKDKINSVMYYPKVKVLDNKAGMFSFVFSFKKSIREKIENIMPFPENSILQAITLGNKNLISDSLKEKLNIIGIRHIVAISGMHIVILSEIIMFILIGLGLWRGQAFWFAVLILILFIIMVGAPASAVRAGIMGIILLLGQKIGRLGESARIVIFAATIMLIFNPLLLRYDVGFQLSFLAVLGIIYLKPIFDSFLENILKKKELNGIIQIITMTFAAQIATLPILIFNFGRISLISPLANLLVVPILPFIMTLGLIFNLSVFVFLGKVLVWPAYFGFTYIVRLTELLAKIPFASININVHFGFLIFYYVLLVGFVCYKKTRKLIRI